jgi:hypothetical protein
MKTKYDQWGTKNIICDNWGEFFTAFKNWHAKNKGIIPSEHYNEKEFDNYVGWEGEGFGDFFSRNEKGETQISFTHEHYANNTKVWAVETVLGNFHKAGRPVNELAVLVLNLSINGSEIRYKDFQKQEKKAGKVLREIWTSGVAKGTHGLDLDWPTANKKSHEKNNSPTSLLSNKNLAGFWIGGTSVFCILSLLIVYLSRKKLKWH